MARPEELVFAPLGGVGEIGMNLSIYGLGNRHQRAWLAVDLGVSFGDEPKDGAVSFDEEPSGPPPPQVKVKVSVHLHGYLSAVPRTRTH